MKMRFPYLNWVREVRVLVWEDLVLERGEGWLLLPCYVVLVAVGGSALALADLMAVAAVLSEMRVLYCVVVAFLLMFLKEDFSLPSLLQRI